MDEKYHQREMQLQNVVDDVTQRSRQEIISLQRKNDVLIAKKNSEIQRFRMELDALLNAVQNVKNTRRASP
jgi:replication fork clamp-binding protein CrfC